MTLGAVCGMRWPNDSACNALSRLKWNMHSTHRGKGMYIEQNGCSEVKWMHVQADAWLIHCREAGSMLCSMSPRVCSGA
jgi:hypothetical protein